MPGQLEIKKTRYNEFGGMQFTRMNTAEVEARLCAAKDCARSGKLQIRVPNGFRIICGQHATLLFMIQLGILGDPSPVPEVRRYAERLGADWEALMTSSAWAPVLPEHFRCLRCSNGLEQSAALAGSQHAAYIHRCTA